jgi:hypothetical protein
MENVGIFIGIGNILRPFGIFYGHLVFVVSIWYILWSHGHTWFPVRVCFAEKKLRKKFASSFSRPNVTRPSMVCSCTWRQFLEMSP